MTNFKKEEIGTMAELGRNYENGKAFLHDLLGLTSCEISVSSMPAGIKLPFNHKHIQNEEIYIFLKGEGIMTLDNEVIEVKEGSCVKVLPKAVRTMESKTDLQYICVQAKTGSLEQFGFGDAKAESFILSAFCMLYIAYTKLFPKLNAFSSSIGNCSSFLFCL